jgi:hypothetical protein
MEERIARYATLSDAVLSTTDCGAVVVETDGREIKTSGTRKARERLF